MWCISFKPLLFNISLRTGAVCGRLWQSVLVCGSTAPKWVPIWGPGSPWGPFSVFGSPLGPHRVPLGPHFLFLSFRTREKSVQPPSNVDYLITCDNTTRFNESHASLSVKVSSILFCRFLDPDHTSQIPQVSLPNSFLLWSPKCFAWFQVANHLIST